MKARIAAGVGLLLLWLEHGALAGITEPRWYATYGGSLALGEANFYSERLVNGLPSQSWGGWMRLEFTQPISKVLQLRAGAQFGIEYSESTRFEHRVGANLLALTPLVRVGLRYTPNFYLKPELFGLVGGRLARARAWTADTGAISGDAWSGVRGVGIGVSGTIVSDHWEWIVSADRRLAGTHTFDHATRDGIAVLPRLQWDAYYAEVGVCLSFY